MTGTDGDAEFVQHLSDVMRVDAVQHERHGPAPVVSVERSEDAQPADA